MWCECKELIDKGVCDKGYAWNPSNCECECDKSCCIGEYSDCRKRLVDKLADECDETVAEVKTLDKREDKCSSCILHIVLLSLFFTIDVGIAIYFVYYKYVNRNKETASRYDYAYQTTI